MYKYIYIYLFIYIYIYIYIYFNLLNPFCPYLPSISKYRLYSGYWTNFTHRPHRHSYLHIIFVGQIMTVPFCPHRRCSMVLDMYHHSFPKIMLHGAGKYINATKREHMEHMGMVLVHVGSESSMTRIQEISSNQQVISIPSPTAPTESETRFYVVVS